MHVLAKRTLREFWEVYTDSEVPLTEWYSNASRTVWQTPQDMKAQYATASILPNNRVVFNIKGNTYRLVVHVDYEHERVYVRFVGTHREYDTINAETI